MDSTFLVGAGAVISAVIVFCGSVWMLLSVVLGGRLAYFVTASVALGFLLIMGLVWSISPLGPVGALPAWEPVGAADQPSGIELDSVADYPGGSWAEVDEEDPTEQTQGTELEGDSADVLEKAINDGDVKSFDDVGDALVDSDKTRLLQDGGKLYGAVTFGSVEQGGKGSAVVAMEYDFGNALGPPRTIAIGTAVLFALHLFGLSRSERRARRRLAEVPG